MSGVGWFLPCRPRPLERSARLQARLMVDWSPMTQVDQLLNEAMKLDETGRSELTRRLLETLEEVDEDVDPAWREEVRQRVAKIRTGEANLIPWEEAERRLFAK